MKRSKCTLIAEEIRRTIERLYLRIKDRFPQSSLANICRELLEISTEAPQTVQWIAKPNYLLRLEGVLKVSRGAFRLSDRS